MKYNLNLTEDYVQHWGLSEAIRELIANNIDEGGTLSYSASTTSNPSDRLSELTFITEKELPLEAFLLGYSVKSNPNAIGQYGEGLKLAMLVLTRLHKQVLFKSGAHFYRFFFDVPEGFGVSTLHFEQGELAINFIDEEDRPITGTQITIFDIERSVFEDQYTYAPMDSVIKGRRGLFCQGLLVEKDFWFRIGSVEYGANLNAPVKTNRDRNYFPNKELISPIIERFFKPEQLLDISTSWYATGSVYNNMSPDFKQKIARAWFLRNSISYTDEMIGDRRILIPYYYGKRYARRDDYLIASYWGYGNYIMSDEDSKVLDSLEIDDSRIEAPSDRAEIRRLHINAILFDCRKSVDIWELVRSLVNYIPALGSDRQQTEDEIVAIAKETLFELQVPKITKPRKPRVKKVTAKDGKD